MRAVRLAPVMLGMATLTLLGGCDGVGSVLTLGNGVQLDQQAAHPSGTVVVLQSVRTTPDRTAVTLRVLNGQNHEIRLATNDKATAILADDGARLPLVPLAANPRLEVPANREATVELVFQGALPSSGRATLIINDGASNLSEYSRQPGFQFAIPLDDARVSSVAETTTMARIGAMPTTRLVPAGTATGAMSTTTATTSSLQSVDALKSELGAVETERGLVVSLAGDITFDFDKATLTPAAQGTLDQLAALITAGADGAITIEGHTDARGDDAYNRTLSQGRADAVKAYLVTKGVDAARIKTIGLGELRPVAPNAKADGSDDEDGRQRNRRVEVILPQGERVGGAAAAASKK